jgi:hypothetical protein
MRKIIGSLLIALLVGCSPIATQPPEVVSVNGVQTLNGPAIATQLNTLYNRTFSNCNNSDSQPAFLCSGRDPQSYVKRPCQHL